MEQPSEGFQKEDDLNFSGKNGRGDEESQMMVGSYCPFQLYSYR